MSTPIPMIGCCDGCGRQVPADQVQASGWELLPIQQRYRCVQCWRGPEGRQRTA